jgi:hypothetical protein
MTVCVAQRVSYTTKVCAHQIKDVLVAHVCRAGAGMQQPSPIDDCKKCVEPGEDCPGRARDTNARVVRAVPTACAEPMQPARISRLLSLRWRVRLQQACAQAALLGQAVDEPANIQR